MHRHKTFFFLEQGRKRERKSKKLCEGPQPRVPKTFSSNELQDFTTFFSFRFFFLNFFPDPAYKREMICDTLVKSNCVFQEEFDFLIKFFPNRRYFNIFVQK